MQTRKFGKFPLDVSAIGFGAWAIGGSWGPQDEQDSLAALHRAIDLGVNFIDTAAGYGNGKSELLIAQVLKQRSERVYVATKTPPLPGNWPPSPYDIAVARAKSICAAAARAIRRSADGWKRGSRRQSFPPPIRSASTRNSSKRRRSRGWRNAR